MSSLTKIFIVLQLVCSLVLAVLVVSMVAGQEPYKKNLDAANLKAFGQSAVIAKVTNDLEAAKQMAATGNVETSKVIAGLNQKVDTLNNNISQLKIEKDTLEAKNAAGVNAQSQAAAAIDGLTKQLASANDEIKRMSPENVSLIGKNADLSRQNNELTTQLGFAERSIRKLQEQVSLLSENTNKSGSTGVSNESGPVASLTVQTPAQINGKITKVSPTAGRTLIELPLGTRDGVKKGTTFMVYRDQGYIADAVVESVYPDTSVAAVDPSKVKKGETVKAGDMVISGTEK